MMEYKPPADNNRSKIQSIQRDYRGKNSLNSEYNCPAKVLLCAKTNVGFCTFSIILAIVKGIQEGKKYQTLLGVTGSRKNIYYG